MSKGDSVCRMEQTAVMTPGTLGERLRMLRFRAGLKQGQLATAIGVSRQSIGNWENGEHEPDTVNAVRLADALGVDLHELLDIDPVPCIVTDTGTRTPRSRCSDLVGPYVSDREESFSLIGGSSSRQALRSRRVVDLAAYAAAGAPRMSAS